LKRELITETCATIAFSAIKNNDKVGLILFSDRWRSSSRPRRVGATSCGWYASCLNSVRPTGPPDITEALRYLNNVIKKRSIAFLISDLMDDGYDDALKIANRKHDLVVLRTVDPREGELPNVGLVQFADPETGDVRWVNTASRSIRNAYRAAALKRQNRSRELLRRSGVDHATISTHSGYVKPLMNLFKEREGAR
jgi:uncharacterized protein (DUF58 family)